VSEVLASGWSLLEVC